LNCYMPVLVLVLVPVPVPVLVLVPVPVPVLVLVLVPVLVLVLVSNLLPTPCSRTQRCRRFPPLARRPARRC
jgi:hypothetical protein